MRHISAYQRTKTKVKKSAPVKLSDDELLDLAKNSDNGEALKSCGMDSGRRLTQANLKADMALCCKLAFWSNKDKQQMDRLFRQSGLYREKWDIKHHASGATYGEETLNKAIESTENTYSPGNDTAIFEYDGCYFRAKGDKIYPITNFIFQPIEMIVADEETQLTADLVTNNGEVFRQTFMTTDFSNQQKFKNMLNKRTIALSYTGSDGDLELLKSYISNLDWQVKKGVKAMGMYKHGNGIVFVTNDGAVDAYGQTVSDMIQLEKYRSIESGILEAKPLTKEQLQMLGERIMNYNEPAKTVPILAWMAGCFIKAHLRERILNFRILC